MKFQERIRFVDGFEASYFILFKDKRRTLFAPYKEQPNLSGVHPKYRITNWKTYDPEVVGHLS